MLQVLWVDKYRPRKMDELYHPEISQTLSDLSKTNDFPHMIFYGPEGAGKKTRVINFIQQVYSLPTLTLTQQIKSFKLESPNKTIQYTILSSNVHIQITPADNEYDDRHIIQRVVKDIASSNQINQKSSKKFKILVINEADRLSKEAQGSLRRTMQKYMSSCRMILVCKNIHKLISPIRSRCVNLRIPAPSAEIIRQILERIAKQQSFDITSEMIDRIIKVSGRNLRDAISQLQCYKYSRKSENDIMHPFKPEIKQICKMIISQQSPGQLLKIRGIFYDMLVNCIQPNIILKQVLTQIVFSNKVSDQILKGLINKATELQKTLSQGSKAIVHLQCFAAHAMEAVLITKQNT